MSPRTKTLPPEVDAAIDAITETAGQDAATRTGSKTTASANRHPLVRRLVAPHLQRMKEQHCGVDTIALRERLRPQYRPWQVAAAVLAIGLISEAAASITGQRGLAFAGAGAGWLTLSVTAILVKKQVGASMERIAALHAWIMRRPRWLLACATAANTWLTLAAILGVEHKEQLLALWLSAFYALAARWWSEHRIGYPEDAVEVPGFDLGELDHEPERSDGEQYAHLWATHLATNGSGPFKGTMLTGHELTGTGHDFDIMIPPGSVGLTSIKNAINQIATALDIPAHRITVEDHPSGRPVLGRLRLTVKSPTVGGVEVTLDDHGVPLVAGRPVWDPETGDIGLGPYTDGHSFKSWKLYRKNSLYGGFVYGGQGSGKSEFLNLLMLGMAVTGYTTTWYLDGQLGASSATARRFADWDCSATPARWNLALRAACAVMALRQAENKVLGISGFTPSRQRPGLVLFIDECHKVFADQSNADLAATIAREGRKLGVGIVAATQESTLKAFGGEGKAAAGVLRSCLLQGNGVVMRSMDSVSANVVPGLKGDPTLLPEGGGYAISVQTHDDEGNAHSRDAAFRAGFHEDFAVLLQAFPIIGLDGKAARAADEESGYLRRNDGDGDALIDAIRDALEEFALGRITLDQLLAVENTATTEGRNTRTNAVKNTAGGVPGWDFGTLPTVAALYALDNTSNNGGDNPEDGSPGTPGFAPRDAAAAPDSVADAGSLARLTDVQREVYTAIADGVVRADDILSRTGRSRNAVYAALDVLKGLGHIQQTARGVYQVRQVA